MMRIRTLWFWLPCLAAATCQRCPEDDPVRRWLTCIECNEGELDSVRALALRDRPTLRSLLRDRLLEGPSDELRASLLRQFGRTFTLLRPASDEADRKAHAQFALKRFSAKWRLRAAIALAGVGGAQDALDSAAKGIFRRTTDSLFPGEDRALLIVRDSLSLHPWR
jgi:hypothetical protein